MILIELSISSFNYIDDEWRFRFRNQIKTSSHKVVRFVLNSIDELYEIIDKKDFVYAKRLDTGEILFDPLRPGYLKKNIKDIEDD